MFFENSHIYSQTETMNTFNYKFEITDYKSDKELKDSVNQILEMISEKKVQDYILQKLSKKDVVQLTTPSVIFTFTNCDCADNNNLPF